MQLATRGARRDPELIAEAIAELAVDGEGFGQIVLPRERFHEEPIAALSQWSDSDELPAGSYGARQLGSADAQPAGGIALEGADVEEGQLVPDVVNPRGILSGEEVALGDEQCHEGGSPGTRPVLLGDGRLRAMNGLNGGFKIDPGVRQVQLQSRAPLDRVRPQDSAQFGQERIEPGNDRRGVGFSPQRLGDLASRSLAMTVDDQIREEEAALPTGQVPLDAPALALDNQ